MSDRQMHLVAVMCTGPDVGSWLHPWAENTLESAKFDAIFFADGQAIFSDDTARNGGDLYLLDPIPLAASIASATSRLGIGITVSTSFFQPYGIARSMQTLDVLSGGRMAWNVVTSSTDMEAHRYGLPGLLPKEQRYDRADEVVEACLQLWESFPADAYVADPRSGTFIDPNKLHHFDYSGDYITTCGPISTPPSPQGHPVIMQAGSSPRGREFAARWAEVVFTYQRTAEGMRAFRDDIDDRLVRGGRKPGDVALLPSIQIVVGETESVAREKREYMFSLVDDQTAIARTSMNTNLDLDHVALNAKFDDLVFDGMPKGGATDVFLSAMQKEDLTVIEAARRFAFNDLGPELVGTPEQVANQMQHMFENWGTDGFIVNPNLTPRALEDFARTVVPILQERKLYRSDYSGTTLRGHLQQTSG
jgi:FMN-dependent oxidoreductase (nitrilotriacetate monooxygenase family)